MRIGRLASLDILRGAAMVLMAIDHVRVFAGVPAGGPDPAVFFTRWVTHFCAPIFVFLAGSSAALRGGSLSERSRLLLVRGLWLVFLELTVIHFSWSFNLSMMTEQMAGVIWAIGWCMVLLSALVRLRVWIVGVLGVTVMFGHNLIGPPGDSVSRMGSTLYHGIAAGPLDFGGGVSLMVLYSIVPWVGVMAAGYGFSAVLRFDAAKRDRSCFLIGLGAIGLFLVLRGLNLYGDPFPWSAAGRLSAPLSFLNTTKYPASLSFLLMTLGPAITLIPLLERARGAVVDVLALFGRVPFFFYLLHIPLIHLLAMGISFARFGQVVPWLFTNHPMNPGPQQPGYRWSLGLLYLVWVIAIALLYGACRWFDRFKSRRRDWWLRYV